MLDLNSGGIDETIKSLTTDHGNRHCGITADVSSENDVVDSLKSVRVS